MEEKQALENRAEQPVRRRRAYGGGQQKRLSTTLIVLLLAALIGGALYFSVRGNGKTYQSNTVQFGLRSIGELATQAGYFTNVQTITGSRDVFGVTVPFTQSKYVYSYDGIVKAGVHFERIEVSVDETKKTVTVSLPHAEILDVTVDENSLVVYDESKNIFSPLKLGDIQESMVAMKAEVQNKAVGNGILQNAETNAETLITGFLSGAYPPGEYTVLFSWN